MPQYYGLNIGPVLCEEHWVFKKKKIAKNKIYRKIIKQ